MNNVQFPSNRDAFGCMPNQRRAAQVHAGDVLQIDSILAPSYISHRSAVRDNNHRTDEVFLPLDPTRFRCQEQIWKAE